MPTRDPVRSKRYRILVVDDHPIVCRGLQLLMANQPDMEICGEAASVPEALRQLEANPPDVVIVDLTLEGGHGLELIRQIQSRFGDVKIVVSSMHEETLFAERVLRARDHAYVNKQESADKIVDAIRQVLRGEIFVSSKFASRLCKRLLGGKISGSSLIETLTDRELQVFELIGEGFSAKQIANRLSLSPKTVETHRDKIRTKLNLANASELTRHATQWILEGLRLPSDQS